MSQEPVEALSKKNSRIPTGASEELTAMIRGFDRQALHAVMLRP